MTTYPSTLLIIVTVTLLYPSTLMSEPWKKSKNQAEITYLPVLPQNQLVNTHCPNVLPTVSCCPANANRCIPPFKKTQVSSDPVLLISPVGTTLHWHWSSKDIKQGLNFLKLTKSEVDFESSTVETGLTLYPANTHYMQSSNSTIIVLKSDVYQPCQLLLNEKACLMIALMLTIVIILTALASYTHCHFNPPFKKQSKPFVSSERNLTWKQLLTYGTTVHLKIRFFSGSALVIWSSN